MIASAVRQKIQEKMKESREPPRESGAAKELKEQAREKMESAARGQREKLKEAARGRREQVVDGEGPVDRDSDIVDRARRAGEARAPVDVSLDMQGDPRALEAFASASGGGVLRRVPGNRSDGFPLLEYMTVAGLGDGDGDEYGLTFDDPLNVAYGDEGGDGDAHPLDLDDPFGVAPGRDGGGESPGWF